ncbi:S-methyl-5-thioribose kinase [Halobacillus naozhouensis]|uniref:S-methyl-5-thioribose kinase n=1 Tax=Halobacillus naozhouensis TaxID=554880 RepID=A0ABY8IW94_9BACI|nr:S-methyl-5-thioribose kinase [Halobacillus naozhouensis]WFT74475.1 S-methyl-5-thioribose kinase [Halobacillus naozhouensis]
MEDYRKLTTMEVVEYVKTIPGLFPKQAELTCREVGGGDLNLFFRVQERENKNNSVILKQALPFTRTWGPSWPLNYDWIRVEYETLSIQNELCGDLVPNVYHFDKKLSLIIMEDLSTYHILKKGFNVQNCYHYLPKHIGTFLARTLFLTSDFGAASEERQRFKTQFQNEAMRRISEEINFTYPFTEHQADCFDPLIKASLSEIYYNDELKAEIEKIKHQFTSNKQALIHGNLHIGNIMVTDNDTKVINAEFASYGPMGFDIGVFIANVLMAYVCIGKDKHMAYKNYLLDLIQAVWDEFEGAFRQLSEQPGNDTLMLTNPNRFLSTLLHDSLGFAGCELMRRVIGTSCAEDLERIENDETRATVETFALFIGQHLVLKRNHVQNLNELILSLQQLENSNGQRDSIV